LFAIGSAIRTESTSYVVKRHFDPLDVRPQDPIDLVRDLFIVFAVLSIEKALALRLPKIHTSGMLVTALIPVDVFLRARW
jgi:hypothetical protein